MESLNSNSQERELHQLQQMQDKAKKSCMTSFRLLHSFLQKSNLGKEEFQETESMDAFRALKTQGGEIDQDAEQYQVKSPLLNAEFFKTKDMVEKEVYNELSNRFLQLEKHCISLEISIQQKEESFQSNKPCKNQDSPNFREFFEINELKVQLQAKNSTINNLKKQIKNVHEKSNEAKVKHDIDVIETINIELEHKVAKLLKENETLKKHYKDLYDSIKVTRTKTIEQTTSLIAKNDECKAQLQEKVFTIAALKNELRKLNSQNWRDLPRDNPLVSVEVLRYDKKGSKSENKGIVPTEIELVLEQTQQGTSHELSVSTEGVEE
ncbi:hypothetical protein Tco_0825988 [Tanacetum coccineum]